MTDLLPAFSGEERKSHSSGSYGNLHRKSRRDLLPVRPGGNFRGRRGFLIENLKNLLDDYYELAWGYPQAGRSFHVKTRARF